MGKKHDRDDSAGTREETSGKFRATPLGKGNASPMHNIQDGDQRQYGGYLEGADHGVQYAVYPFDREAAYVGRQLASCVRQGNAPSQEMLATLGRLMGAPASNASDVLAFAVTAQTLLVLLRPISDEHDEAMTCVRLLIARTVETLELLSGHDSGQFTGAMPAVN